MNFELGSVVLPATDGMLSELGYDVKGLGPLALGVVTEEGSKRSHVHFPEIKLSLWLNHQEIKDVEDEILRDPGFAAVKELFEEKPAQMLMPLLMNHLIRKFRVSHILGVDHGPLGDVWEEAPDKLGEYYTGAPTINVFRLSLGLEELNPSDLEKIKAELGERLLIVRFLPSGMYKFELSLYLKR